MYEVACVFCQGVHRSPYWDAIDEGISDCLAKAPRWMRGYVKDVVAREPIIRCEEEPGRRAASQLSDERESGGP